MENFVKLGGMITLSWAQYHYKNLCNDKNKVLKEKVS